MTAAQKQSHLQNIATPLKSIIDNLLNNQAGLTYTKDPEMEEKDIIEYNSRMRASGMAKFNSPCYISVINFYKSSEDIEKKNSLGALIIYLQSENTERILRACGQKMSSHVDEETLMEQAGELCANIAETLKSQLANKGFSGYVLSKPTSYQNNVPEGVSFNYDQYRMYEMNFFLWKTRAFSVEITLAPM